MERSLYWLLDMNRLKDEAERLQAAALIDREKITRVLVSFAMVTTSGLPSLEDSAISAQTLETVRQVFPKATLGLAVGGWNPQMDKAWSAALKHPQPFVTGLKAIMKPLGLQAVALDFEFPTSRQRAGFTKLVHTTAAGLGEIGVADISVAINVSPSLHAGIDISAITAVSRLELMTYDLYGPWNNAIGPNSPNDWALDRVQYFLDKGVPPDRLLGGFAFYGRQYEGTIPGQPVTKRIKQAGDNGLANYLIEPLLDNPHWHKAYSEGASYLINTQENRIISFSSPRDIQERAYGLNDKQVGRFGWQAGQMTAEDLRAFVA